MRITRQARRSGWRALVGGAALALAAGPAWALGPVDLGLEAGLWSNDVSGSVRDSGSDIDVEGVMRLPGETLGYARASLHVTGLGTFHAGWANLGRSATGTLSSTISFAGRSFSQGSTLDSNVDLTVYDVGWTFSLLDVGAASAHLGLDVKWYDGTVRLSSGGTTAQSDLSVPVPMLKAALRFGLPFLEAEVGGEGIAIAGNRMTDLRAAVRFHPLPLVYLTGGYRYMDLKLEDGSKRADVRLEGPFFGLGLDL